MQVIVVRRVRGVPRYYVKYLEDEFYSNGESYKLDILILSKEHQFAIFYEKYNKEGNKYDVFRSGNDETTYQLCMD